MKKNLIAWFFRIFLVGIISNSQTTTVKNNTPKNSANTLTLKQHIADIKTKLEEIHNSLKKYNIKYVKYDNLNKVILRWVEQSYIFQLDKEKIHSNNNILTPLSKGGTLELGLKQEKKIGDTNIKIVKNLKMGMDFNKFIENSANIYKTHKNIIESKEKNYENMHKILYDRSKLFLQVIKFTEEINDQLSVLEQSDQTWDYNTLLFKIQFNIYNVTCLLYKLREADLKFESLIPIKKTNSNEIFLPHFLKTTNNQSKIMLPVKQNTDKGFVQKTFEFINNNLNAFNTKGEINVNLSELPNPFISSGSSSNTNKEFIEFKTSLDIKVGTLINTLIQYTKRNKLSHIQMLNRNNRINSTRSILKKKIEELNEDQIFLSQIELYNKRKTELYFDNTYNSLKKKIKILNEELSTKTKMLKSLFKKCEKI